MRNGVIIDDRDNVVVAIYPLHAGDELRLGASTVFAVVEGMPERWT